MQRTRHVDTTVAGFATSAFWIGMTLGRYTLGSISDKFGVHRSVAMYIAISIGLQIGLNVLSQTTITLLLIGINGFFLAPVFPSGIIVLVSRTEPRNQIAVVAVAIAFGQIGAAVAPLGIGFMASSVGIGYLLEVILGLTVAMLSVWVWFSVRTHNAVAERCA